MVDQRRIEQALSESDRHLDLFERGREPDLTVGS